MLTTKEALERAVKIAGEAQREWDAAPAGMRAGKILMALAGYAPGYRSDVDEIHQAVAAPPADDKKCEWTADGEDSWNTACKKHFYFTDGDPADNGFEHCPFCGGWLFIPNEADS